MPRGARGRHGEVNRLAFAEFAVGGIGATVDAFAGMDTCGT